MSDTFASWLLPEVASEHDDMNRKYFEDGTVGTYPYFYMLRDVIKTIIDTDGKPLSCLDVGCGAGWQAKYLETVGLTGQKGLLYEGLDISPHMCALAQKNFPSGKFYVGDVLEFTPNRTWALMMACGSMEHFTDWKEFLTKMTTFSSKWVVLHKVFFTDNNAPTWIFKRAMYQGIEEVRVVMNYCEFTTTMNALGFSIEKRYDWPGVSGVVARRI